MAIGRPRNPLGTWGEIRTYRQGKGWISRTLVMDLDGVRRQVQKSGGTKDAAVRALKESLRDRRGGPSTGDLKPTDRLSVAAEAWWDEEVVAAGRLALATREKYRRVLDSYIVPGIGALKIQDLTVGTISRWLRLIEGAHGGPTAKMCRSVLSSIAGYCAKRDLLAQNPVRDAGAITVKTEPKRALEPAEVRVMRAGLRADPQAVRRDLPDLVDIMLATGVRISEAVAFRPIDFHPYADHRAPAPMLDVSGSIVRVTGKGLTRQEERDENSKLKIRTLKLPSWAERMVVNRLAMLDERSMLVDSGPLFSAMRGGWRDPSNTNADLRDALNGIGFDWVTSHTFRRTVATRADRAGLTATASAAQLGHSRPSMTQDRYISRVFVDTGVADVLEAFGEP